VSLESQREVKRGREKERKRGKNKEKLERERERERLKDRETEWPLHYKKIGVLSRFQNGSTDRVLKSRFEPF
jgi:hypothetical protein